MGYWFDRQGNEIDIAEAERLLSDPEARQVASTHLGDYWVSTVHLVLAHDLWTPGRPKIFETAIFRPTALFPPEDVTVIVGRWETEAVAIAQHDQTVAALRDGKDPGEV